MSKRIPARAWVGMMLFWCTFINFMFRSHYQISVLAMVVPRNNETVENYGPRFDWSTQWEQQTISALFYGFSIISIPAGWFVTQFGPTNLLLGSAILMAIFSDIIVPMAYFVGPGGVFAMRFLIGLIIGVQYPAMMNLIANWAPPQEKGRFVGCLMGQAFGSIITMPCESFIIEAWGWEWSFYILSIVVFVFCVLLLLLVADHPRFYRWIRQEEVDFIEASHGTTVSTAKVKNKPPYLRMYISCPFWAVVAAQYGNQYVLFLELTTVPQYLKRRLAFDLKASAEIAAIPHIARLVFGFIYGILNDALIKRGVHKKYCRKGFTVISHILCGITLCMFLAIGDSQFAAILILVLMMVFNGASVVTCLINTQDLAPNWSGTLYGNMNAFGGTSGFLIPILVDKITTENTMLQWAIVFSIGGLVAVGTGIIFIVFGSVELQPWNEVEEVSRREPANKEIT